MIGTKQKLKEDSKAIQAMQQAKLKLALHIENFYKEVSEDNELNKKRFDEFNADWKKQAHYKNTIQKRIKVNPMAFEQKIQEYIDKAIKKELKQQNKDDKQAN